jgi:hypothetical protein
MQSAGSKRFISAGTVAPPNGAATAAERAHKTVMQTPLVSKFIILFTPTSSMFSSSVLRHTRGNDQS